MQRPAKPSTPVRFRPWPPSRIVPALVGESSIEASELSDAEGAAAPGSGRARTILLTLGFLLLTGLLAAAAGAAYWLNADRMNLQEQLLRQSMQVVELREKLTRTE